MISPKKANPMTTIMSEDEQITQDRLILAVIALEKIEAMGGPAGKIAMDCLDGFRRADEAEGDGNG